MGIPPLPPPLVPSTLSLQRSQPPSSESTRCLLFFRSGDLCFSAMSVGMVVWCGAMGKGCGEESEAFLRVPVDPLFTVKPNCQFLFRNVGRKPLQPYNSKAVKLLCFQHQGEEYINSVYMCVCVCECIQHFYSFFREVLLYIFLGASSPPPRLLAVSSSTLQVKADALSLEKIKRFVCFSRPQK